MWFSAVFSLKISWPQKQAGFRLYFQKDEEKKYDEKKEEEKVEEMQSYLLISINEHRKTNSWILGV